MIESFVMSVEVLKFALNYDVWNCMDFGIFGRKL